MSRKKKLEHFAEMKTFPHVFEPPTEEVLNSEYRLKGLWKKEVFKNTNDLVLELGCGKGEYTVGMGRRFSQKNFIGVDIKGARMWRGAKTSLEEGLNNVAFLRTRIEFITSCFALNEVDEIWITFPDPQMKEKREKKRLTGPLFIQRYLQFLKPGGLIHLKTDSSFFYEYTMDQIKEHGYKLIEASDDLYGEKIGGMNSDMRDILSIQTHYEALFKAKGHSIHYVKFSPYVS